MNLKKKKKRLKPYRKEKEEENKIKCLVLEQKHG